MSPASLQQTVLGVRQDEGLVVLERLDGNLGVGGDLGGVLKHRAGVLAAEVVRHGAVAPAHHHAQPLALLQLELETNIL